jgi:hypothetical protein
MIWTGEHYEAGSVGAIYTALLLIFAFMPAALNRR